MKALVLEKKGEINLREINIEENLGDNDVKIKIDVVGICGSDVHFYQHGEIGPFVVREPMVLGHEAAGIITEVGSNVTNLKIGDKVCMEPGIPNPNNKPTQLGMYNLDPDVRFWATPPIHGCLRESVVHPASFTFKLPENISTEEGALVEPLAVGIHSVNKANVKPGDVAVVTGAGTIGLFTAVAAIAGGCSKVIISDIVQERLDLAKTLGPVIPVNVTKENLNDVVMKETDGWGADIIFEASGNEKAITSIFEPLCPGGTVVFIGIPLKPAPINIVEAMAKEARMETIFRYAHVYPRALALMGAGKIDVKPFITETYYLEDGIAAFDYASNPKPTSVKVQIKVSRALDPRMLGS